MTEGGGVSSGNQQRNSKVVRRPCKDLVVDNTITNIILPVDFRRVSVEHKRSGNIYKLRETPKKGIQITM